MSDELVYMPPRLAVDDLAEVGDGNPKLCGKLSVEHSFAAQPANLTNIGLGERRSVVLSTPPSLWGKAQALGVLNILKLCAPFQVFRQIIQLVSIYVIGNVALCGRASSERFKHQTMNGSHNAPAISSKANKHIPVDLVLRNNSQTGSAQSAANSNVFSDNRSYASVIGHFVRRFKANNWLPNFAIHCGILATVTGEIKQIRS